MLMLKFKAKTFASQFILRKAVKSTGELIFDWKTFSFSIEIFGKMNWFEKIR